MNNTQTKTDKQAPAAQVQPLVRQDEEEKLRQVFAVWCAKRVFDESEYSEIELLFMSFLAGVVYARGERSA